ncbi:glutamine synthetase beta-grasp domain-containing protein [Anatilimnocola floriformis]|uniref:glutamine synthetase beta-grasp domain-containing protein n=1 Tax=Anatilimnocola floriformis TaxID=2948575 RepID=UPI0020C4F7CF|nr:glutamine synthetase beta-grasp domain-containing protein [Anatilimnocola floriformis]
MTPREILALCREKEVRVVDLRLADLAGRWTQISVPVSRLDEDLFEEGIGFDGSQLWGGPTAKASDLIALPQPDTAYLDPTAAIPTLAILCNLQDPLTREPFARDPRQIAQRAENYLRSTGFADAASIGAKAQFFVFDEASFANTATASSCQVSSATNQAELHSEILQALSEAGLPVEGELQASSPWHPTAIGLARQPIVATADALLTYKHIVRQVARRRNKRATFMPQPLGEGPGCGLHTHFSFWKKEQSIFAGHGYAGLSEIGLYAIGGVLRHAPALLALCNPTTNSYKRLAPGSAGEAKWGYSQQNRTATCRIPVYNASPKSRRVAFRTPDPSCNPYLAFAAIVLAAIDGIQLKLHPGQPLEEQRNGSRSSEQAIPATLDDALSALEDDQEFLLRDDVFTPEVLQTWIEQKRRTEIQPLRLRPHPLEFSQYFDC